MYQTFSHHAERLLTMRNYDHDVDRHHHHHHYQYFFFQSYSCLINQYCFAANEINPTDFCSQCLPDINKNSWTKRKGKLVNESSIIPSLAHSFYPSFINLSFFFINISFPVHCPRLFLLSFLHLYTRLVQHFLAQSFINIFFNNVYLTLGKMR